MEEDLYLTDTEPDNDEHTWNDVDNVSFSYIKTGNSTLDGMLTTHDFHFKVQYSFFFI